MRGMLVVGCVVALAAGCRAVPPSSAARTSSSENGRIPITTRSDAARALYLRGRTLNENLQPHEAHLLFQQAVAIDPTFALGEYSLAATAPTARELALHLQRALALADSASVGERLMIQGLEARTHGDPDGARRAAESLVARYPKDERAHWTLASACSAQQLYDRTIAELRAAIAINPQYSLAYNQLGYAYRSVGDMTSAEMAFRDYIALVPTDPNPYDSYAELLMKTGRFDESIAQYRKALSIDEHFTGSFVGIASNEMLAGRHDAAVAESERYFSVARDDRERRAALVTLAQIRVDQGETELALRAMARRAGIARSGGDTVNLSADLGIVADILLESGRVDAARDSFAVAHALIAGSGVAADVKRDDALASHYDGARLALATGDVAAARADAIAYLTGATARHNDARIRQAHELNGRVALAAKQFDESLAQLALADQENPAVLYVKARALDGRGESTRARELVDQAMHMNILPTFPYVFTRASVAAATRSATSGSAGGRPR